MEKNNTK